MAQTVLVDSHGIVAVVATLHETRCKPPAARLGGRTGPFPDSHLPMASRSLVYFPLGRGVGREKEPRSQGAKEPCTKSLWPRIPPHQL